MIDVNKMRFWGADDGGGGGSDGGGEETSPGMAVFEGDTPAQTQPEPAEKLLLNHNSLPVTGPSFVDASQLAEKFGHVIGQHFQPPPKEMTVQEAKRLLNVWEPTPEWLAKYDNIETRDQAIAEQRDGLIRQADTIMRYRMNEMQQADGSAVWSGGRLHAETGGAGRGVSVRAALSAVEPAGFEAAAV